MRALRGRIRGEGGQVLPLVAIAAVVLIGFVGFAVDLGRVWVAKQQLQRAVDAAALVAGQDLPDTSTAYSAAISYAGTGTRGNSVGGWGVKVKSPSVTFECLSHGPDYTTAGSTPTCLTDTSGDSCHPGQANTPVPSGVTTCNAVNVTESATVKTSLLSMFIPSFTIHASSTAAARGSGVPNPINAFVILDTTGSMTSRCSAGVTGISNPTKLDCAKSGVRSMLQALTPCQTNLTTCGSATSHNVANPVDEVGLLVFPAISMTLNSTTTGGSGGGGWGGWGGGGGGGGGGGTTTYSLTGPPASALTDEANCGSNENFSVTYPPWQNYSYSATATAGGIPLSGPTAYNDPNGDNYLGYEAVPLSSDYRTTDSSTALNLGSSLVDAVDWGESGCTSYPGNDNYGVKDISGQGSYLAGAITEAQYLLATAPSRVGPNGQAPTNVIIILSDGEMNNPNSSRDGVDPGASGNKGWTSSTPCEDAFNAAKQAKAAGTLIYTIGYDSSGNCDSTYTAAGLMQDMASSSSDYYNETNANDLGVVFGKVGTELSGDSALIPDCTQAPPNC